MIWAAARVSLTLYTPRGRTPGGGGLSDMTTLNWCEQVSGDECNNDMDTHISGASASKVKHMRGEKDGLAII